MSTHSTSSTKNRPIGIFDSGVGGTSIWKEIHELLPLESSIYLADSKNAPYGTKSKEEIIKLCEKNTDLLIEKGCKLIVVACNTATTNAIKHLRTKYELPFIGIEPAIKPALLQTKRKVIGILATKGTLSSDLFHHAVQLYKGGVELVEQDGTGIVELIEKGQLRSKEMHELLEKYLEPMIQKKIDYLVLGCSHYPYLIPILTKMLPAHVSIIDSGLAVARQTKTILEQEDLLKEYTTSAPFHLFYINKKKEVLKGILKGDYAVEETDF